jgi:hypothetical protein
MDEHLEPQPPNAESGPEGRVRRCRAAEGGGIRRPGHGSPRQPVKNPARDEPRRGSEGPPKSVRVKRAGSTGCRRSGESPILAEVCRRSIGIKNFARDKCHVDVWLFRIASDRRGDGRRRRPQLSTGGVVHLASGAGGCICGPVSPEETSMKSCLNVLRGTIAPGSTIAASLTRERPMQRLVLAGCPDFWRLWSVLSSSPCVGWPGVPGADAATLAAHLTGCRE